MTNINDFNYVLTHLDEFNPFDVIYLYKNNKEFNEDFIIQNLSYFQDNIIQIVKFKKELSDDFFVKICSKKNYLELKCTRQLLEPFRDFKTLDNLFY
jgi:hypothetical protein